MPFEVNEDGREDERWSDEGDVNGPAAAVLREKGERRLDEADATYGDSPCGECEIPQPSPSKSISA